MKKSAAVIDFALLAVPGATAAAHPAEGAGDARIGYCERAGTGSYPYLCVGAGEDGSTDDICALVVWESQESNLEWWNGDNTGDGRVDDKIIRRICASLS